MINDSSLTQAVHYFAQVTQTLTDANLELDWSWGSYDSEGIRFAFFRTFEELRTLAVHLRQERQRLGSPLTSAQHILAGYQAAYGDLQGALVGLASEDFERQPPAGAWPLRQVLSHIISADLGFSVMIQYALERQRNPDLPPEISDAHWERISGLDEKAYHAIMDAPAENLRAYYSTQHLHTLANFATITDAELELPSMYWEKEPMSIRFRLHRFESHLRQHTIQVDKTLADIGHRPSEAMRLLRMLFLALAEVQGLRLGAPEVAGATCAELAQAITARADEIAALPASGNPSTLSGK